jgi:hypothetical protein
MNTESVGHQEGAQQAYEASSQGLAVLSGMTLDHGDAEEILRATTDAVGALGPCSVVATYRSVNGAFVGCPPSQPERPDIEQLIHEQGCADGEVPVGDAEWGWAFGLRHQNTVNGCLIVSAADKPVESQMLLLDVLARQAGAALAYAAMHESDAGKARQLGKTNAQLEDTNRQLATTVLRLQRQTKVHEVLGAAVAAGLGEQGIADGLHGLTALPVVLEDRFGNLRCWAGPGRPEHYPKQQQDGREQLLHRLGAHSGPVRVRDRLLILVQPRTEILGVLALIDPDSQATEDNLFALQYGASVLALELAHQRNVAEIELNLRREIVDDLLAGTDPDGAYARAEALGHDLHRAHYVVVIQGAGRSDGVIANAAGRAADALKLNYLQGRRAGLAVLLADGRPDPRALHRAISEHLGSTTTVIGIGSRCETPDDFPRSFTEARRALNIRLLSANPAGASAYDELGFYRLIDAAHGAGAVEDFVREWLGALMDYDENKNADLVHTLSSYLECGGSYDEAAAALHIHRSTLRYRLTRIRDLTGVDLRNVDTRFNLHAATRAWRFLNPDR